MLRNTVLGALLGMLGLIFAAVGISPPANEHDNFYHLIINDEVSCSATSVGPHALLTATHCLANMQSLTIDGRGYVDVIKTVSDGNDHSVLFLSYTFRSWSTFGQTPYQTQDVHMYHSPGNYPDMYSRGYVSGRRIVKGKYVTLFDLPVFYGSSGAAILDSQGQIIAVDSMVIQLTAKGADYQQAASWDFAFTPEQMESMTR